MKAISFAFLSVLFGCTAHNQVDTVEQQTLYTGTYTLSCDNYVRTTGHMPVGIFSQGFETTLITLGGTDQQRTLRTYKDTLALRLTGNTFTFDPVTKTEVSGGGVFRNDTLRYERVYTYKDKGLEQVCNCIGRKFK